MTLRVGNERHDEHGNGYFPILRDGALEESVGTAYDKGTAALFAAAPELLAIAETVSCLNRPRSPEWAERQRIAHELPERLQLAIAKAKGGRP